MISMHQIHILEDEAYHMHGIINTDILVQSLRFYFI